MAQSPILIKATIGAAMRLPLVGSRVAAGFPSPADDYIETQLDLNEHLIHRPAATFFVRTTGNSMEGAGIHSGDLLVVDRAERATSGKVVIASVDGELLVKRLVRHGRRLHLEAENPAFPPLVFEHEDATELVIWGVVTAVIHRP